MTSPQRKSVSSREVPIAGMRLQAGRRAARGEDVAGTGAVLRRPAARRQAGAARLARPGGRRLRRVPGPPGVHTAVPSPGPEGPLTPRSAASTVVAPTDGGRPLEVPLSTG